MKIKLLMAGAALAAGVLVSAPAFAVTLDWTFTGTNTGNGQMTVGANDQVTSFDGSYDGQALTFYANPNFPGTFNLHDPHTPNTGGADLIADDFYSPTTGVDVNGILVSTGAGATERVFAISLDNPGATQTDFFSINPNGQFLIDNGTFSTAVPEPASWAMMLVGFGGLGVAMRTRRKALVAAT
jgi:hypothetical protein